MKTEPVKASSVAATDVVPRVVSWWAESARDLPWRDSRDPWLVLVSEVMAQQTQVERVIPKWRAFIDRFPTVGSAASGSPGEFIELWDGLGYNRRALQLHACAVQIEERFGGTIPNDLDELLSLPGIGPYTARAVLAFAFEQDVGVLDTNVGRVLARISGSPLGPKDAQRLADALVPPGGGWEWNQAVLDFGAAICQKRTPYCSVCPVSDTCSWAGEGADPAVGSAGVGTGQSKFEGSDRQGRGRLVARLRAAPVPVSEAGDVMGFVESPERTDRVLNSLLRDGLVVQDGDYLRLP